MSAVPAPLRSPAAEPVRRPQLRVVPARRRRVRAAFVLGVVVAVGSLFLVVAGNVVVAQRHLELEQLRSEQAEAQAAYERHRLTVAELSAPANLVAAATELGLVEPDAVEYLAVPDAAPHGGESRPDQTASTLRDTHDRGKPHLVPGG